MSENEERHTLWDETGIFRPQVRSYLRGEQEALTAPPLETSLSDFINNDEGAEELAPSEQYVNEEQYDPFVFTSPDPPPNTQESQPDPVYTQHAFWQRMPRLLRCRTPRHGEVMNRNDAAIAINLRKIMYWFFQGRAQLKPDILKLTVRDISVVRHKTTKKLLKAYERLRMNPSIRHRVLSLMSTLLFGSYFYNKYRQLRRSLSLIQRRARSYIQQRRLAEWHAIQDY